MHGDFLHQHDPFKVTMPRKRQCSLWSWQTGYFARWRIDDGWGNFCRIRNCLSRASRICIAGEAYSCNRPKAPRLVFSESSWELKVASTLEMIWMSYETAGRLERELDITTTRSRVRLRCHVLQSSLEVGVGSARKHRAFCSTICRWCVGSACVSICWLGGALAPQPQVLPRPGYP